MAIDAVNISVNGTKYEPQTPPAPAPAPAPEAAPVSETSPAPAPVVRSEALQSNQELALGWEGVETGRPRIAMIDDWVPESNGFNHGDSLTRQIQDANGGNADMLLYNIDTPGGNRNANITAALGDIARRAEAGERFDAVNLSQQDFAVNGETGAVSQAISDLQTRYGIPVVVAAGNDGALSQNALAQSAAVVVENSTVGQDGRALGSGLGNIRSEGEFTSQATANVTARLAQLRSQGYDTATALRALQVESQFEGGSLDRRSFAPAPVSARPMSAWNFAQTMQAPAEAAAPAPLAAAPTYSVQLGDTLSALSARWGVGVEQIAQANNIADPNLILVGQQLVNPAGAAPAPAAAPAPSPYGSYEIKPGDTVWDLAVVRGGMTLDEFAALNPQIADLNLIYPGQVIQLPTASLAA